MPGQREVTRGTRSNSTRLRTLRTWRNVGRWKTRVTAHARWWGRYRKFVASSTSKNPVDPFIDPEGYRTFIDAAEAEFRSGRVH